MFSICISHLVVTFLSLMSHVFTLMQTTKEIKPHYPIAPRVDIGTPWNLPAWRIHTVHLPKPPTYLWSQKIGEALLLLLYFCLSSLHRSCKCLALCGLMERFNWILGLRFENVLDFDLDRIRLAHTGMAFSSAWVQRRHFVFHCRVGTRILSAKWVTWSRAIHVMERWVCNSGEWQSRCSCCGWRIICELRGLVIAGVPRFWWCKGGYYKVLRFGGSWWRNLDWSNLGQIWSSISTYKLARFQKHVLNSFYDCNN